MAAKASKGVKIVCFTLGAFFTLKIFSWKKTNRFEIVSIASIYTATYAYPLAHPPPPFPRPSYRASIYRHLILPTTICESLFFHENFFYLWEFVLFHENSFWNFLIRENLFFLWKSFWIFLNGDNLFFLWKSFESFFLSEHLFIFVRTLFYFFFCENICLYENKPAYECHSLKQIFYHQNMVTIFCWFHMFQAYALWLEFF